MWSVVVALSLLLFALILAAPLAAASGHSFFAFTIYKTFSHLCHQAPERSFFIAGHPFAVCARCTGLYAGFAAAILFYPLVTSVRRTATPERKWLFIAAAPMAIDFGLGFFGIWENTHSSRLFTGLLLGAVAVFYVMPGLADLSTYWGSKIRRADFSTHPSTAQGVTTSERIAAAPSDYSSPLRRI
jgi:uncharacterized membrane protein